MSLDWKIPPSEAIADHGEYAVQLVDGEAACMYKMNGGFWRFQGSSKVENGDKLAAIAKAREIGDQHHKRILELVHQIQTQL